MNGKIQVGSTSPELLVFQGELFGLNILPFILFSDGVKMHIVARA